MSLEIGEITSFCVSVINVGVSSVWGLVFLALALYIVLPQTALTKRATD